MDLKALEKAITSETACVLIQSPNFFGTIEDVAAIAEIAHKNGAMLAVSIAEAVSLGIVEPPRKLTSLPWKRSHSVFRWVSAALTVA